MELLNELGKSISKEKKKFESLYKMSKDGHKPEMFHNMCDNKGPTVTVIQTIDNVVYGGYTSGSWSSQCGFKRDSDAFIFFKNDQKKLEVVRIDKSAVSYAIYCKENLGPTFGGGAITSFDLKTFSSKVTKRPDNKFLLDGSTKFNTTYNRCSEEFEYFAFNTFKVKDVEVFMVQDDELKTNWRSEIKKSGDELRGIFYGLQPANKIGAQRYNILLTGMIGAGKSSFCNTFLSAVKGKITEVAAYGNAGYSVTNKLTPYSFEPKDKTMSVRLFDIRGIEEDRGLENEIEYILDGKLPKQYVFEEKSTELTKKDLHTESGIDDKIHMLCFVLEATKIEVLSEKQKQHITRVQSTAHHKDLQIVALLTKIDELCSNVSADLNHLYKSPTVLKAVKLTTALLGIQKKHVYPVCNYTDERESSEYKDRLALDAVLNMIQGIEDYFERFEVPKIQSQGWRSRGKDLESMFIKDQIHAYEYSELATEHGLRVLVMGPKQSGKSSFLNIIMTSLLGKIHLKAPAGISDAKRTKKLQAYPLKSISGDGTTKTLNITLVDMPGLNDEEDEINDSDISFVLGGHAPNKFQFKDHVNESMDKFKAKPMVGDKPQCVCFIIDITEIGNKGKQTNQRIKRIMADLLDKEIPFVIFLTKVDKLCPELEADVSKVYESQRVKKRVDEIKDLFDISYADIFPIKNYTIDSTKTQKDMDSLILESLKEIMDRCEMFLENYEESDEE